MGDDKARSIDNGNIVSNKGGDIMNADQLKGKWMQFKGELKKQYGKFTDDDLQQIEGIYDRFVGKVQERYGYGDEKRELMKWADAWHQKSAPKAVEKKSP
jgi:uncharacterized protein YjbJ (UPF0337 family)